MKFPNHIITFIDNRGEVKRLVDIHIKIAGTSVGRKAEVEVLHKSAIVLLTACWESYIETIVTDAFDILLKNADDYKVFPNSVLVKASKEIKNDKDDRKVWDLAGDGWKNVLIDYKNSLLKKEIDHFHVPRASNIDDLFYKIIGLENLSKNWTWKGQNNNDSIQTLELFIDLRGSIAHKIKVNKSIRKTDILYYLNFINNLTVSTNNCVNNYLKDRLGEKPWDNLTYTVRKKY